MKKVGDKIVAIKPFFSMNPVCGYHTTVDKEYEIIEVKEIPKTQGFSMYGIIEFEAKNMLIIKGDFGVNLWIDYYDDRFKWEEEPHKEEI